MIDALVSTLLGPVGGILAAIGAVILAWALGRYTGGSDALVKRDAQEAKGYRDETKRIQKDLSDIRGDGAAMRRLHEIAKRRGASPD